MEQVEKQIRLDMSKTHPRILAKNAVVGKEYLTVGMLYKVKVVKINGTNLGCTSVTIESESNINNKHLNISGGTELIAYDKDLHIPSLTESPASEKISSVIESPASEKIETKKEDTSEADVKKETTPNKSKKVNMSSIINPLLMEGKSAEDIADVVIEALSGVDQDVPDKAALIRQIRGPRKYNLIKKLEKENKIIPDHLLLKGEKKK